MGEKKKERKEKKKRGSLTKLEEGKEKKNGAGLTDMSLFLIDDQEKDFCVFTLGVASFFPSMMCVKDSTPIHGLFISNVVVVESHLHTLFFFFLLSYS